MIELIHLYVTHYVNNNQNNQIFCYKMVHVAYNTCPHIRTNYNLMFETETTQSLNNNIFPTDINFDKQF